MPTVLMADAAAAAQEGDRRSAHTSQPAADAICTSHASCTLSVHHAPAMAMVLRKGAGSQCHRTREGAWPGEEALPIWYAPMQSAMTAKTKRKPAMYR